MCLSSQFAIAFFFFLNLVLFLSQGSVAEPKVGDVVVGHPLSVLSKEGGMLVSLPFSTVGRVDITNVTDRYIDNPLQAAKKLDFVK